MNKKQKTLLVIDCIVNLVLGILLLLFTVGIIDLFGLPKTNTNFYPSILGAILFGIGLALFFERVGYAKRFRGLGIGGAIVINIVGSLVLICWLIFGSLNIPLRGQIILWVVGVVVFLIGILEIATKSWTYEQSGFHTKCLGPQLVHDHTTVDIDDFAGDEAGRIRHQKNNSCRHFMGLSQALQGNGSDDLFALFFGPFRYRRPIWLSI